MPSKEVWFLLAGIIIFFTLWFTVYRATHKWAVARTAIAKTAYIRDFYIYAGGLFISAVGLFIATTTGGAIMSPELVEMAKGLYVLIWLLFGVMVGAIILFVIKFVWAIIVGRQSVNQEIDESTGLEPSVKDARTSKPSTTINLNIDSADVANMKPIPRKTLLEIIDRIQGDKPKGKHE